MVKSSGGIRHRWDIRHDRYCAFDGYRNVAWGLTIERTRCGGTSRCFEAQWRIVEGVPDGATRVQTPVHQYEPGTWGLDGEVVELVACCVKFSIAPPKISELKLWRGTVQTAVFCATM